MKISIDLRAFVTFMLTVHTRGGQEISLPPLQVVGVLQLYPHDSKLNLEVQLRHWLHNAAVSLINTWNNTQNVDTYGSVHIDIDGITASEFFKIENSFNDISARTESTLSSMWMI